MSAYYNEIDPFAAQWLRNLIAAGLQRCGATGKIGLCDGARLELADRSPTNGFWRDADWLGCRDGKWRPVEPGTFPLAHGVAGRVGRLRAYGNAINAYQAEAFITAYLESL